MKLAHNEAVAWVAEVFRRNGASPANAEAIGRALVAAEADGLKGHGLSRIPTYLLMLATGKADGQAKPTVTRTAPGVISIDAANGFAYPAIEVALAELPAITRLQGIAAAAIHRSNHCGAAGHHAEALANEGLVAFMFSNAPAAIAPWGGKVPVFGTNPVAFAAPVTGGPPIVIDLSVSKVARGNILAARQKGEPIPEGWALDKDGNPTTDAQAALAGTMVPMGDAKGAALALMVEILSAVLVGAKLSFEQTSFFDGEGPSPGTGQLIIAMDPKAFGHQGFGERMAALAGAVTSQDGTRLPGARRIGLRDKALADGITVPAEVLKAIG